MPQRGQIDRRLMLSSFMGLHPFSAVPTGFQELVNGESEEPVALAADAQVAAGGNAVGSFLSHDVHESPPAPELAGADAFDIQRHLGFVVEAGVPFVAVQCQLILVGDLSATMSSDEFKIGKKIPLLVMRRGIKYDIQKLGSQLFNNIA